MTNVHYDKPLTASIVVLLQGSFTHPARLEIAGKRLDQARGIAAVAAATAVL